MRKQGNLLPERGDIWATSLGNWRICKGEPLFDIFSSTGGNWRIYYWWVISRGPCRCRSVILELFHTLGRRWSLPVERRANQRQSASFCTLFENINNGDSVTTQSIRWLKLHHRRLQFLAKPIQTNNDALKPARSTSSITDTLFYKNRKVLLYEYLIKKIWNRAFNEVLQQNQGKDVYE